MHHFQKIAVCAAAAFFAANYPTLRARDIAPPVVEKFAAVAAEIDREEKAQTLDETDARQARSALAAVQRMAGQRSSFETLLTHARQTATTAKTPELRQAWNDTVAALGGEQKAVEEAQKKLFTEREELFHRAADACANATKPDDLAGILADLQGAVKVPRESRSSVEFSGLNEQHSQLVEAMNFVASWKQMLADAATGDDPSAISRLRSMSRSTSGRVAQQIPTTVLETRLKELQEKRAARLDEILKNAARDLPAAKTAKEAQAIADNLRTAADELGGRRYDQPLTRAAEVAQTWAEILRADEDGDSSAALEKLAELSPRRSRGEQRVLTPDALETKRKALWKKLSAQYDAALANFSGELRNAQTTAESRALAEKYQALSEDLGSHRGTALRRQPEFAQLAARLSAATATATAWAGVLAAEESRRWSEALRALTDFTKSTRSEVDPSLVPPEKIDEKRRHFLREIFSAAGIAFDEKDADWRRAVARSVVAISKPEDASALAAATRKLASALDENGELQNLQADLAALAAEWSAGAESISFRENISHPWRAEMQRIREGLVRARVAQQFALSEITAPPLDARPLPEALNTLADQCAARGEWQRVLGCVSALRQAAPRQTAPQENNAQAISDFLAAGNFERAEQWPEAIRAYQNVLRATGPRVPVREATDRLRALKREHPELFSAKADDEKTAPGATVSPGG